MMYPDWIDEIPEQFKPFMKAMLDGPEEISSLMKRIKADERVLIESPPWLNKAVQDLRPLSRKFIAREFEKVGYPLVENEHTRMLGFFGDWKPSTL